MRKRIEASPAERAVAREIMRNIRDLIDTQTAFVAQCERLGWRGPRVEKIEAQLAKLDTDIHHAELARAVVLRMTAQTKPSAA